MPNTLLDFLRTHDEAFRSRSRLASLYSDFTSQRSTNPDGYNANSTAWLLALSSAAKNGLLPGKFVIQAGEELLRDLDCEYGRPLALEAVLEDAVQIGKLIEVREFLAKKESLYRKRWIPTVGEVVGWGLKQLGLRGNGSFIKGGFVVLANVEAAAKTVLDQLERTATSPSSRIFSRELFQNTFGPTIGSDGLNADDISVLITHLARDREAAAYDPASGTLKFKSAAETQPSPVMEEDISIASLRSLISSLEPQISHLGTRISELEASAREAVSKKQLHSAKIALRQKKAAETKLTQRSSTMAQLEDVYAKIEQASDQVEIVKVMAQSGRALKSLNKQTGGVESVQDVMDGLREDMQYVENVENAINEAAAGEVDEGEVEYELEALEKVENEKKEAIERAEREKREAEEKVVQEKKQAEENDEREKKEAQEAEVTRSRLAKLETVSCEMPHEKEVKQAENAPA